MKIAFKDFHHPPPEDTSFFSFHGLDHGIMKLGEWIPQEFVGFVLAVGLVAVVLILFFMLKLLRPDENRVNRRRLKKNAKKTRALALAAGFMVDDVERDMPDISSDGQSYVMTRSGCQRYHLPQIMRSKTEWRLACRPGDISESFPVAGWKLELLRGELSGEYTALLARIMADIAPPGQFFEMEVAHQALYFYWYEHGGRPMVEELLAVVDALKDMT
jgi:hypothetical protein